jgi:hypothetical protein
MSALLCLSGWDVLTVFLIGSLSGLSLAQAIACLTMHRKRTMTRLQRQRWRELAIFGLRNGRTAE